MNKAGRYVLLASCLLVGLLVAGCSDGGTVNQAEDSVQLAEAFTQGKALSVSFTDARVAGMKGIAENDLLKLFVDDKTGAVAVIHKQSGEIWHSNPPERESDPLAAGVNKGVLSSQLKIDFYNLFGQLSAVNSFSDSVVYKQIKFEEIPSGVRVSYQFGTSKKTMDDMPMKMSKARFEEKVLSKLDNTGKRALKIAYTEDKENSVYERNDGALKGLQLDRALKAFEDAGYTEEDLVADIAENNLDQTKPEPRIFLASIEYVLDGDSLVAKVPVSSIQYPEEYPVNTISLLSFFGAGGPESKGSILVPDGAGALIHFNNGKTNYPAYQQQIYGADQTMDTTENAVRTQEARLPVFGIIREGGAFLGIIEEGESVATINADISGRLNSYNYVYPSFSVLNKGDLSLDANGQQRSLPKFQENPVMSDLTVRYAFLDGEDASYQGMAAYYQQYLMQKNGLPHLEAADGKDDIPFYLQLIGSISKKKHIAGIPYQSLEPLTTFEQAQSIVTQMQQRDIHEIKLKYSGWFNKGLDHEVPDNLSVDRAIGGSRGLKDFVSFAKEQGVSFYPDVAILTAHSGSGFNKTKEASRTLRGVPAALYPLDTALNRRDRNSLPSYVVSPKMVGKFTDAMLKDFGGFKTGGISLRDLADQLNSDYRENNQVDRAESEGISIQSLNKIREANLTMMADGGNAYALPYLSDITNAPMSNSKFKIEDEEIPFYQMVVRGFIDYTGAPYNLSTYTDVKQYVLKCLEYGAGVYFEWIYEPNHKVKDTEYNDLYAVNYELWIDQAAEIYQEVNGVLKNVRNERITGHEKLSEGVFKTVYENGAYVIVNYNRSQVTAGGRTVEAESYITGGGQS
ncbi:DUF5696 domain-containing protein [Paenibacillus sp. LHD-38]|uniref:DUF5696 domain-containing protein n=1 Tax=Paenibacillus sp. LHD-38 TaxID=3072143 RepID=UPI002810929B|nr:DUF5696 domain-containing protein [Paenibacillus sp. LHD-38]MDQ8735659.1 DUF5696 domain-containing protein [Paenibacillus sp. LHD-38]